LLLQGGNMTDPFPLKRIPRRGISSPCFIHDAFYALKLQLAISTLDLRLVLSRSIECNKGALTEGKDQYG
jgi:hypothetical protein